MLAYAGTYHIDDIINAIKLADEYRQKAESTGGLQYVEILADAEYAIKQAQFTESQREVTELLWLHGFTQEAAARLLGVSQAAVFQRTQAAKGRLQKVLASWRTEI